VAHFVERVLLVDDDVEVCKALKRGAARWAGEVVCAHSLAEGLEKLSTRPDLLLVDLKLGDGSGAELVEAAAARPPLPLIVAMTAVASRDEVFRLSQLGARGFLEKPFEASALEALVRHLVAQPIDVQAIARSALGKEGLVVLRRMLASSMVTQALSATHGNIKASARLLGVTRQAVQRQARRSTAASMSRPAGSRGSE
jgi:DNA-binding NtrC family response regulator